MSKLFLMILLILLSAFFSAGETAYASANSSRLKNKDHEKRLSTRAAVYIKEHYDSALLAVLIGNNLINNAASAVAAILAISLLGDNNKATAVSTACTTLLILIFGEILPKIVAKRRPESVARAFSVPLLGIYYLLRPLVLLIDLVIRLLSKVWATKASDAEAVSEDDLETVIELVEDEGVLDEDQCDLLQNALDFNDVLAYEIITPRVDMLAIDIHDTPDKNRQILLQSPYSRIPVYEDTPDHIIGILHLNRYYQALVSAPDEKIAIRPLMVEPVFVHKTMPLPDVLDKMKQQSRHMVVVLDEYGGTMGILTMEDVLEQLVGDIWDESDEVEEEFICVDDTHYEALGEMRVEDLFDELNMDDPEDEEDFEDANVTLGGWATDCLDGEVSEGANFRYKNLSVTVLSYENMRIERLGIEVLEEETDEQE